MWFHLPNPILAANLGSWMFVAVIVMMFIGWIMNLVNKQNRPAQAARGRRRQPPRRGEGRLQSEIDSFLEEVGGRRPQRETEEVPIEIVEEEERRPPRRPPRRRPKSRPPARPPRPSQEAAASTASPTERLSERHLKSTIGSTKLGEGLRSHLQQYMADDHVDAQVAKDLSHRVGSEWAAHPEREARGGGNIEFASPHAREAALAANQIASLLRNPAGVRQAILVSEILSPPKSRR